ncbi:hypothetical protein HK414_13150 [Ramlibacter terrae]|uniref:Uncharacterized protein n=1 Tax=Ramlibacter terrae TaxID=2732511 RepID=A0ABX6P2U7_9BURK|nr:hypothetical protein HK414_13150 [Ramlibacter terrae]
MAQRVFIKVVGFTDEERHALNTVFRLSEQCRTMYQLWTPDAPEPPGMSLLDGLSYEGRLEAEMPLNGDLKILWVGPGAPPQVWRSMDRPISWPEVIEAMDSLFVGEPLDFDIDIGAPTTGMSLKQALIVCADRDERLYLRARLSLAHLTQADEAESGTRRWNWRAPSSTTWRWSASGCPTWTAGRCCENCVTASGRSRTWPSRRPGVRCRSMCAPGWAARKRCWMRRRIRRG